jgi:hypothetical protein
MNLHHKRLIPDDEERRTVRPAQVPLRARPVRNPRSYQEMLEDGKKSFPKILAYLAR